MRCGTGGPWIRNVRLSSGTRSSGSLDKGTQIPEMVALPVHFPTGGAVVELAVPFRHFRGKE